MISAPKDPLSTPDTVDYEWGGRKCVEREKFLCEVIGHHLLVRCYNNNSQLLVGRLPEELY